MTQALPKTSPPHIALTVCTAIGLSHAAAGAQAPLAEPFPPIVNLRALDGLTGVQVDSGQELDALGVGLAGTGDVNGDGIDDFAFGAVGASRGGEVYVVFGSAAGLPSPLDPTNLNGTNGFRIEGGVSNGAIGATIAPAGDINGDGLDDLVLGDRGYGCEPTPYGCAAGQGRAYVIFGRDATTSPFPPSISVRPIAPAYGFAITNSYCAPSSGGTGEQFGAWVAGGGDLNGDGLDDIAFGPYASGNHHCAYVVFGRDDGFPGLVNLGHSLATYGFAFSFERPSRFRREVAVAMLGDINGDGVDDLAVSPGSRFAGGSSVQPVVHVIYGRAGTPFPVELHADDLNGTLGFTLLGAPDTSSTYAFTRAAGDVNGDGVDDLLVGLPVASPLGRVDAGQIAVVYGRTDGSFEAEELLPNTAGANGFLIYGEEAFAYLGFLRRMSRAGDVNGDGVGDLLIGSLFRTDRTTRDAIVFGRFGNRTEDVDLAAFAAADGVALEGEIPSGRRWDEFNRHAVAAAGDVNADGRADLLIGGAAPGERQTRSYVLFGRGEPCRIDLDGDGTLTIFDFLAFQNLFQDGDPAADFDGDGELTLFDFLAFQNTFDAGCA